ncbi:hypothetical protein DICVIV_01149 [Dictyocaulus viviparus]|uniref:Tudor domain-containing protein n=1 Tax=Dictyocaulus viviparus TaxID=29172 RepID=A0A0D8Y783_DICVI|nr:hypothetical protein DICVIV_01149 [Dictyocaulus viviparus]
MVHKNLYIIQVLSCNEFANVLYLDSGGTELVLPHSLYKIHPSHCSYPAMCMQMCMFGVAPSAGKGQLEWNDEAKALWKKLLREDLPIVVSVLKRLNYADDNRVLSATEPPWCRPGVMFIQFMKVFGDSVSILEKFCSPSKCPRNGVFCDDVPRSWIYNK